MRCDWPVVSEEDCIEPPCEIFLQLFIQNVEMAVDDNPDDDNNDDYDFPFGNGGELNEHDADEIIHNSGPILIDEGDFFSDDSDDSMALSVPSIIITDAELTPSSVAPSSDDSEDSTTMLVPSTFMTDTELTPSSSVEEGSEFHCEESNNDTHCNRNSLSGMSQHSEESSFIQNISCNEVEHQESDSFDESEVMEPMEVETDVHPRRGPGCACNLCEGIELVTDVHPRRGSRCETSEEIELISDAHSRRESRYEVSEEIELATDVHPRRRSRREVSENVELMTNIHQRRESRCEVSEEVELMTDMLPRRGSTHAEVALNTDAHPISDSLEEASNFDVISQEFEKYSSAVSSKDISLSSGMTHLKKSNVESEPSSSKNSLQPSTHVSLYVVVPPTSFPNETGNTLLPGVSTDLPGLISINTPYCPSSLAADNDNFQLGNVSIRNSPKISDLIDDLPSCTSVTSNITFTEDNQVSNASNVDSASDNSVSDSKSEGIHFEDKQSVNQESVYDDTSSEETGTLKKNTNSDILDKSSLKRKVSSADETVLNKVPKYSSSDTSESVNQESLDYCKVLSNNSEKQTPHAEDKIDVVSPSVASDNVILTLGKSVQQTSVVNGKPKSR